MLIRPTVRHTVIGVLGLALACTTDTGDSAGDDDDGKGGSGGDAVGGDGGQTASGGANGGGGGEAGGGGASAGTAGTRAGGSGGSVGGTGGASAATLAYEMDFEAIATGQRPPAKEVGGYGVSGNNKMMVVEDKAYSGKKSIYFETTQDSAFFTVDIRAKLASAPTSTYVRMMVWLNNLPGGDGHWNLFSIGGYAVGPGGSGISSVGWGGGNDDSSRFIYLGGGTDCARTAKPFAFALKSWHCVELMFDDKAMPFQYSAKVDGQDVGGSQLLVNGAGAGCPGANGVYWPMPAGWSLSFGWKYFHSQGNPVTMWMDDLAVSNKPIGCPPGK